MASEITAQKMPSCYKNGTFWIHPAQPFFALQKAMNTGDGLNPSGVYHPPVFLWLPHLLEGQPKIMCPNSECGLYMKQTNPMTIKCWNDNPIARRVIGLDCNYYVMTQRIQCRKYGGSGCGKSYNLYDPLILDQLDPGLVAEFPAFLTHRSGIDKTVMSLIRAGIAHRLSSSAWSKILRELHMRNHDLREIKYLYAIQRDQKLCESIGAEAKLYQPFSAFNDKTAYNGFSPSKKYINNIYMDYMQQIRPVLDQCMSSLTGHIIKWDHSFKLAKYMMKLNSVVTFSALFTLVNEFEQIRWQAFVPTKALSHIKAGLEGMVVSLNDHGLPQPILGFTDNVAGDYATFVECIPSLGKDVSPVQLAEYSDLPRIHLPDDISVHVCGTEAEIQNACMSILENVSDMEQAHLHIGFDAEWEFTTGPSGNSQKIALIQIALSKSVYLLQVFALKQLPTSLKILLGSRKVIKVGRNVGGDLAKISLDFTDFQLPPKEKGKFIGVVELGQLAAKKNAVLDGRASLATIAAATLHGYLSKECRLSEWSNPSLTDEQKEYAALDAYVALEIWKVLGAQTQYGQPISPVIQVGQLISLYVRKQEVAQGTIVDQPPFYMVSNDDNSASLKINVSTTKTRALIQVDNVLVPNVILPYHKKSLKDLQNGQESFLAIVNISSLRTRCSVPPMSLEDALEQRNISIQTILKPPESTQQQLEDEDDAHSDSSQSNDEDEDQQKFMEQSFSYHQPAESIRIPSRILADVFHEIDKVCRTISKKHTLHRRFSIAFSETVLIPDEDDKAAVTTVLTKMNITWDKIKSKSPSWLWTRVRRYVPEKGILYILLKELFDSWGPVKCTITKQTLFSHETWKKANGVLHDVQKGWISDPSSIPVYTVKGMDKNGLKLYHCIRGTNSVEGAIHNPIRRNFASLNASPALADALISDFRHRHNTDCGTMNKIGKSYGGHYDPWLDHEIYKLRADISWTQKPATLPWCIIQETDPMAFVQTQEQFGITCIPPIIRIANDFLGPEISLDSVSVTSNYIVHLTNLHLSKLHGKQNDVYAFLANAQGTKYAVAPIHTKDEFDLFNSSVSVGGPMCPARGLPNFDKMACWWSTKADGKTIFYKLREHLAAHYKVWTQCRQEKQTMVASQSVRQANERRIKSTAHVSKVLPPALQNRPGQSVENQTTWSGLGSLEHEPSHHGADSIDSIQQEMALDLETPMEIISPEIAESLGMSATQNCNQNQNLSMIRVQPEQLPTTTLQGSNMQLQMTVAPQSAFDNFVMYQTEPQRPKRRCTVCLGMGRDGYNCPGVTKRSKCIFAQVGLQFCVEMCMCIC